MKRVISVLALLVLLAGCGGITLRPSEPSPECPNSLIDPIKTEWIIGAGVVKIGVIEVVKRNMELRPKVLEAIDSLAYGLQSDSATGYIPTYAGWAASVISQINLLNRYVSGASVIVAGDIITEVFVGIDVEIDICDKSILLRDLAQLKMLIGSL